MHGSGRDFLRECRRQEPVERRLLIPVSDYQVEGGHMGYDVRPSMRRHGYGTGFPAAQIMSEKSGKLIRQYLDRDQLTQGEAIIRW